MPDTGGSRCSSLPANSAFDSSFPDGKVAIRVAVHPSVDSNSAVTVDERPEYAFCLGNGRIGAFDSEETPGQLKRVVSR